MFITGIRVSILALTMACGMSVGLSATRALAQVPSEPKMSETKDNSPQKAVEPDALPIRKITLYRSGVGYFERQADISGNAQFQLRFSTDQINDILKSMILLDLGGGKVESVSYGSKEPLAKRLASFGVNIADNPSAGDLLSRLRGTPVKIMGPAGEASGTIMNVETRATVYRGTTEQAASVHNLPWINLLTKDGVKSYNMTEVTGFQILDASLADELNKALAALAEYRADRTKTVDVKFSGKGDRKVVVGYVHEMPVWKTSYRLVLPDPAADAATKPEKSGKMSMQGWAIVENTTDQDWNNVRLSLVSGRPVSFQMDLYEPLFTFRPFVPVPTIPGVNPRAYATGTEVEKEKDRSGLAIRKMDMATLESQGFGKPRSAARALAPAAAMESAGFNHDGNVTADDIASYMAQSQAQAVEVGEVFQYQLDAPVSIERQRSAMLPILSDTVNGRRVSIYSPGDNADHPMRGVEIVNETGLQLLPGPISVFDGAAYAGDAQISHVSKGDKRLLAYSLDLDVNTITKNEGNSDVVKLKIVGGMFEQISKSRNETKYAFDNKDAKRARTIIVEQPKLIGWNLVSAAKPAEETQGLLRFEVEAPAGKKGELTVTFERTESTSIGMTSFNDETILQFHKNGKLSDAVLLAVKEAARRQGEINTQKRTLAQIVQQSEDISKEQTRIRDNMGRLDRTDPLYTRYVKKLTDQETSLEDLRDKREKAERKLNELNDEYASYLRTLNVE